MGHKSYTLLLTSNRKGRTWSFSVTAAIFKLALSLFCIFAVLLSAVSMDYVGLLLEMNENKRLRAENESLRRQFAVVDSKVKSLEVGLERVKSFSTKLKLITNVSDEDRSMKLSIGANPQRGQAVSELNEPLVDRKPTSHFLREDSLFFSRAPLDRVRKELTREGRDYAMLSIRIDRAVKETELREQGVLELYETLVERQSLLNATPSTKPVHGLYSSHFGYRVDPFSGRPEMHRGLDIAAPIGTPVYSPAKGVVSYVGYEPGYGKLVTIDHGYGVKTRYAHNSRIFVELGQKVDRQDVIAAVGNTGRSSGPHLHYEVRVHGVPVDPINYILTFDE